MSIRYFWVSTCALSCLRNWVANYRTAFAERKPCMHMLRSNAFHCRRKKCAGNISQAYSSLRYELDKHMNQKTLNFGASETKTVDGSTAIPSFCESSRGAVWSCNAVTYLRFLINFFYKSYTWLDFHDICQFTLLYFQIFDSGYNDELTTLSPMNLFLPKNKFGPSTTGFIIRHRQVFCTFSSYFSNVWRKPSPV